MHLSYERLNILSQINSSETYLEVGVNKGRTFELVQVPFKVAVDPAFRFDYNSIANDQTRFHESTSDQFFTNHAKDYSSFDLIFLDGLHTFDQTLRDFCSSLRFAHSRTIWVIDDTYPTHYLESWRNEKLNRRVRKLSKTKHIGWLGDVFKTVSVIHDFFPQYSYATFTDRGQTVIWPEPRENFRPAWNSLHKISRLNYFDFLRYKKTLMNVEEDDVIFDRVQGRFGKLELP